MTWPPRIVEALHEVVNPRGEVIQITEMTNSSIMLLVRQGGVEAVIMRSGKIIVLDDGKGDEQ